MLLLNSTMQKQYLGASGFIPGRTTHLKLVLTASFCYTESAISLVKLSYSCVFTHTDTHTQETITEDLFRLKDYMHFMSHYSLFAFALSSFDALFPPQGIVSVLVYISVFLIFAKCAPDKSLA